MNPYKIENALNSVVTKINTVQEELKKFGFDEADTLSNVELVIKKYDREAYVDTTQAFNFVIKQIDNLIDFVGIPVSKRLFTMKNLTLNSFNEEVDELTTNMHKALDKVRKALELSGVFVAFDPFEDIDVPNDDTPEESNGKENIKPTINRGYTQLQSFPTQNLSTIQGAGFDDDYWYAFGTYPDSARPMVLSVIHKTDPAKSFVAKGNLGTFLSGSSPELVPGTSNILGHANDCSVVEKNGSDVTLLVSSMIPNQVATCVVDLESKTAVLGKVIPVVNDDGSSSGVVSSSQTLGDGRVILKCGGKYRIGMYDPNGIKLTAFAKYTANKAKIAIEQRFGSDFWEGRVVGQADWYENGYIYMSCWESTTHKSLIIELDPKGPDEFAQPTGRFWWDESAGHSFEIEKVWFEKGQMRIVTAMKNPSQHFISEPHWRY